MGTKDFIYILRCKSLILHLCCDLVDMLSHFMPHIQLGWWVVEHLFSSFLQLGHEKEMNRSCVCVIAPIFQASLARTALPCSPALIFHILPCSLTALRSTHLILRGFGVITAKGVRAYTNVHEPPCTGMRSHHFL